MGRLEGKVVLITGAARGQGEAEARLFVEEGAQVVLGDVLDTEGEGVAKSLGEDTIYLHHDVGDPQSWERFVDAARLRFGRIDGLVNNAGVTRDNLVLRMKDADWDAVEGHHLARTYRFKNFGEALAYTNEVGEMAESQNHHPDLHLAWGRVTVEIWTHKIDGLHESDFVFAAKCDALASG